MSCQVNAGKMAAQAARRQGVTMVSSKSATTTQVSFFETSQSQVSFFETLPKSTTIPLSRVFTPAELQQVRIQLRLGEASTRRHLQNLRTLLPDLEQRDPRPLDWTQSDQKCYAYLIEGLSQARQGAGELDLSALSTADRLELWEFAGHEADRLLRQVEQLQGPGGPQGETKEYLTGNYRLLARFYHHLADQLEPLLPADEVEAIQAWRSLG